MRYLLLILGFLIVAIPAFAGIHGSGTIPYFIDQTLNNISIGPGTLASVTTGTNNAAIGINALANDTIGYSNVVIGYNAGSNIVSGQQNIVLGDSANTVSGTTATAIAIGTSAKAGGTDTAIGYSALGQEAADNSNNTAIGELALNSMTTGKYNTAVGVGAGYFLSGGSSGNTAVGTDALQLASGNVTNNNTSIGWHTGITLTTGTNNTYLGYGVGSTTLASGSNNILIGTSTAIDATTSSISNEIHIGGSGGDWIRVGGTDTQLTQTTTIYGNILVPQVTTGTNADFVCMSSGNKLTLQTSACTISSLRFKKEVQYLGRGALLEIDKLKPVSFKMKDMASPNPDMNFYNRQLGLTAENVAIVDPRMAIYENDGKTPKSYRQESVIALLVKGMQEQQGQIDHIREGRDGYRCYGIFWCKD